VEPDEPIDWTPRARHILATASALFYEHGITAVGVDRIAERSGITKRTLYHRFGSKERLVAEYLRARDTAWRALLEQRIAEGPDTPRARLQAIFDASDEWMRERGDRGCSMVNAHAELPREHPGYPVAVGQKRWIRELFGSLTEQLDLPDPDAAAETITLLHEGALVCHGMGIGEAPIQHARDAALALVDAAAPRD
jgi:AcrR family transcriptional regulator